MTIFFHRHVYNEHITVITYVIRWIIPTILNPLLPYPLINLVVFFSTVFLITLNYEGSLLKKFLNTLIIFICSLIAELITALIMGIYNLNILEEADYGNLITTIILESIFGLTTIIVQKFKNIKTNAPFEKIFIIGIILIPAASIVLELLLLKQADISKYAIFISLTCILAINFIILYIYDSLSKIFQEKAELEIIKREKNYYHQQSELLQKRQEELSQFRHDIKNRMIAMQEILEKNNCPDALKYTEQITKKLSNTKCYSNTENIAIDSIINYKLTLATEQDVVVSSHITIPTELAIDADDCVVILGNLLDNALEATNHLEKDKYISVTMEYNHGCIILSIKNSYDSYLKFINGRLKSRKEDDAIHGIGLQSVQSVLNKYHGILELDYDNSNFCVTAIMYL